MKRAALLSLALVHALGACGGGDAAPDALVGCQLDLRGNVSESAASQASCPMLAAGAGSTEGDTLLLFTVPSQALAADLTIRIDLGHEPTPGVYNSGTTSLWSAMGARAVPPEGACLYIAGNAADPTGDFVLDLAAIDLAAMTAHGTLALTLFVLPRASDSGAQTDCGPGTTEDLQLVF